ncbi:hypothetical protein M8Q06_18380, partial [Enterobacter roggenkampii]|nr:hypothetical protein [Enterobacter roggenkampii]
SAQIREILISESAWEEMTCLFAPSLDAFVLRKLVAVALDQEAHDLRLHTGSDPVFRGEALRQVFEFTALIGVHSDRDVLESWGGFWFGGSRHVWMSFNRLCIAHYRIMRNLALLVKRFPACALLFLAAAQSTAFLRRWLLSHC